MLAHDPENCRDLDLEREPRFARKIAFEQTIPL
jgi:hypothetical protein